MERKLEHPPTQQATTAACSQKRIGMSKRRMAILEATAASAEGLMDINALTENLKVFLASIGQAAGADRAYLVENRKGEIGSQSTNQRLSWVNPGSGPTSITTHSWDSLLLNAGWQRWAEKLEANLKGLKT